MMPNTCGNCGNWGHNGLVGKNGPDRWRACGDPPMDYLDWRDEFVTREDKEGCVNWRPRKEGERDEDKPGETT
jgi:hypothetical protein